jgi:hypothetical protein
VLASSTVKECSQSPGIATKVPAVPSMPWWPPGVNGTFSTDNVQAFVLRLSMGDGSTSSTAVDYLVQKRKAIVRLDSRGHCPPKIPDLPVGKGVFGVCDEGASKWQAF